MDRSRAHGGAWGIWERAGARRDTCLEWVAPLVEPLLTLASFAVLLFGVNAALGADATPSNGRRVAAAVVAGCGAQLLFTLGHWRGVYRPESAEHPRLRTYVFTPFATERERVTALAGIFGRFLVFHAPLFLCFGLLPALSPVPMLDFQLVSIVFAIAGHRVSLHEGGAAEPGSSASARPAMDLLPLAAVLGLATALRLHDLDYNGEFIDESFYAYAREVGNLFYVTSDSRLWPMISSAVYSNAGITGVRATTALFGVLTVLCVFRFARRWAAEMDPTEKPATADPARERRYRDVALVAAFLTAVASPSLVTSVIGRHDALAFLLYAFALSQIALAAQADRPVAILLGASALLLAFWTRYALLSYLPLGVLTIVYAQAARRNLYADALVPVALMAFVWVAFDLDHWRLAAEYTRRAPHASAGAIAAEAFARIPIVFLSAALGAAGLFLTRGAGPHGARLGLAAIALPALGTVGIVAAHTLVARTALSLERNLALAAIFGSLLGAWFFVTAAKRISNPAARYATGAAIAAVITLHSWWIVGREKHAWGDPRPVVAAVAEALERYDLGPTTVVWSTDDNGGKGNVHALVVALRGRAIVDSSSPWKPRFWEEARDQRIPLIAGTNRRDPLEALETGAVVRGYVVDRRVEVPYGPAAYVYVRRDLWQAARR